MVQATDRVTPADSSETFAQDQASHPTQSIHAEAAAKQEELKRQAVEMTEAAKAKACQAAEQAKQSGAQYAREKKARVADEIGVFSGAIRKASGKLHDEQHDSIASYVDAAAEQLDRCRQSLESKDVGELVDDVQDFARRRPEVVYGGLFVAGLAAMRFLKASKPSRQHTSHRELSHDQHRPPEAFGHDTTAVANTRPSMASQNECSINLNGGSTS
ncbi:hypothetical protein LF1_37020 [Rubripirellula obstinata]|uniref:Uncharacterized protein n=1 Tax=Rubripirellula obstinata TaxID=406547 RepID=A0A5B1CJ18_9BACT|nr:hypothetical protein [Rubripirellula obstinata]KAA1261157.1 hypothetical protein LF1_37020 [Rubripirellula obstinata]